MKWPKKKEEIEKPLEFNNIKSKQIDKNFKKAYEEMMKREQEVKNKFNIFSEVVYQYKMRDCIFQPNINLDNEEGGEKKKIIKRLNSCEIVQRLYNEGIKNQKEKKENLEQKYKPSFKPKINGNSNNLAKKWKKRIENKKEEANKNNKVINNNNDRKREIKSLKKGIKNNKKKIEDKSKEKIKNINIKEINDNNENKEINDDEKENMDENENKEINKDEINHDINENNDIENNEENKDEINKDNIEEKKEI